MKKHDMLKEISSKIEEMTPLVLEAGLAETHLQFHAESDLLPYDMVRAGYEYICKIYNGPYQEVQKIWKSQKPEHWATYKKWGGFGQHREVILLRRAFKVFRAAIISRGKPDFFKKGKVRVAIKKSKSSNESRKKSRDIRRKGRGIKGNANKDNDNSTGDS